MEGLKNPFLPILTPPAPTDRRPFGYFPFFRSESLATIDGRKNNSDRLPAIARVATKGQEVRAITANFGKRVSLPDKRAG